jgi:imidazolonepropionase-like amidohydrolase
MCTTMKVVGQRRCGHSHLSFAVKLPSFRFFWLIPFALGTATAQERPSPPDLALVGGTVYRDPNAPAIPHATVLIHEGRIVAVGPENSVVIPRGAQRVDCTGKVVTAGFWNSHVHLFVPALLNARTAPPVRLSAQLDSMLNRWGFTTVFDIASVLDNTLALRRRIDSGVVRGPRILTVGEPLWTEIPVYVRAYLAANHIRMDPVTSTPQAVARVRDLASVGADGIKLFTGSYQGGDSVANMPLDMVRAAAAEAHRHRLAVFAHPQNVVGLERAIAGGVDILAHTAPQSPPWTPQFVARLTRAHIALIPTLTLFDVEARKDGESDAAREAWIARMVAELRAFARGGGDVLFGTDVGYIDHYDTSLEYELMGRAGMSFRQILASLTTNPAARFHATQSGRVAPGMDADLVVLSQDPAVDVRAFAKVNFVVRGGRTIYGS